MKDSTEIVSMELLRGLLAILSPFIVLFSAVFIPDIVGQFDLAKEYNYAIYLPIAGLILPYVIIPKSKKVTVCCVYLFGLLLALVACPVSYPEDHPKAAEVTYGPFITTCIVATVTLAILLILPTAPEAEQDGS